MALIENTKCYVNQSDTSGSYTVKPDDFKSITSPYAKLAKVASIALNVSASQIGKSHVEELVSANANKYSLRAYDTIYGLMCLIHNSTLVSGVKLNLPKSWSQQQTWPGPESESGAWPGTETSSTRCVPDWYPSWVPDYNADVHENFVYILKPSDVSGAINGMEVLQRASASINFYGKSQTEARAMWRELALANMKQLEFMTQGSECYPVIKPDSKTEGQAPDTLFPGRVLVVPVSWPTQFLTGKAIAWNRPASGDTKTQLPIQRQAVSYDRAGFDPTASGLAKNISVKDEESSTLPWILGGVTLAGLGIWWMMSGKKR